MHNTGNSGKVIGGLLALFLIFVSFPFWFTWLFGESGERPELTLPEGEARCVEDTEYMRHWHMDLLNQWRDEVVREGKRIYVASDGGKHEMSLSLTCMRCHDDKAKFCDRCHDYVGVSPYCFDCHVAPEGK